MNKKQKWVMGNWKMNPAQLTNVDQIITELNELAAQATQSNNHSHTAKNKVNVGISPTFIHMPYLLQQQINSTLPFAVLAQNCAEYPNTGAHTGEVSAQQIKAINANGVILGHSERRQNQNESNECIVRKVQQALQAQLLVVLCIGETLAERNNGLANSVVINQLQPVLDAIQIDNWQHIVIAYEPIWAIGTGVAASAADAENMHAHIRNFLTAHHPQLALVPLLYGGSVKADNAVELASMPHIDGVLVGGASLEPKQFFSIINAFENASL